jgi:hypothetical protein
MVGVAFINSRESQNLGVPTWIAATLVTHDCVAAIPRHLNGRVNIVTRHLSRRATVLERPFHCFCRYKKEHFRVP